MKKIYNILFVALAIAATASCAKELVPEAEPTTQEGLVELTLRASRSEIDSKADLNSNLSVTWTTTDSISVWDGTQANIFTVASLEKDGAVATFKGTVTEGTTAVTAVYPHDAFVSVQSDTINVSIPDTQTITSGKLADPKALVSYAVAESITASSAELSFKNLVSLMRITIADGDKITKVTVKGNASESIVGAATYAINADASTASGGSTVTLAAEEGDTLVTGYCYMAVAPVDFTTGVTAVSYGAQKAVSVTENQIVLVRNHGVSLGNLATGSQAAVLPMEISTVEEFVTFSKNANYYEASDLVVLTADLDLTNAEDFVPDKTIRFRGSFDGQNHRIYNYKLTSKNGDVSVLPRMGSASAADANYVKNVAFGTKDYDFTTGVGTYDGYSTITFNTMDDGNTYYYPGAIAYIYAYETCENLVNYTPVEVPETSDSRHRAAGLLGTVKANVTIKNCVNYGDVTTYSSCTTVNPSVGGVVGALDGANCVVESCKNYGTITIKVAGNIIDFGGIAGYTNVVGTYTNCENHGNIIADCDMPKTLACGGITSRCTKATTTITNCSNTGDITLNCGTLKTADASYVGGITGRLVGSTVSGCTNSGDIALDVTASGKAAYVGGIIGNTYSTANTLSDCTNSGNVTVTGSGSCAYVGGVIGANAGAAVTMDNCHNTGDICNGYVSTSSNGGAAGVIMYASQTVTLTNSSNTGKISLASEHAANTFVGGISGILGGSGATGTLVNNCVNEGEVIVGCPEQTTATIQTIGAGIAGACAGSITNCENKGAISTNFGTVASRVIIGGVIGGTNYSAVEVSGCKNSGAITVSQAYVDNWNAVGGITGIIGHKKLTNCENTGSITCTVAGPDDVTKQIYTGGLAGVGAAVAPLPQSTVDGSGCKVNCTITVDTNTLPWTGSVLGRNAYATDWTLGTTDSPIAVGGTTINGTAVAEGALIALGSGNTDSSGVHVTINATL